jgi:hypothetical protein
MVIPNSEASWHHISYMPAMLYIKNISYLAAISLTLLLTSCSKQVRFNVSSVVPAAEGSVKITKDANQNLMFKMTVKNLAEPSRLTPPKKTYVLWMQTKHDGIKNLGQVVTSTGYFSSTRTAALTAISQYQPARFFITAEDQASVRYPSATTVLTTKDL